MTKPFIVVQGPVATRSGYGNHTRDLAIALIQSEKYDIKILSLPWGDTPMDALKGDNPDHVAIANCIARENIQRQPDVFIQVSVSNEFMRMGKYNIGITAGIETTIVSPDFLKGANNMDLVLTTSEHSKKSYLDAVYDAIDEKTKQKSGELKLEKPIEVLFEGVDLNVYKKTKDIHEDLKTELSGITDEFCFLFVGHWLKGMLGQDRKDIGMMIKTICEAFKRKGAKKRPGLILKTSHAGFSILDRDGIMNKIQQVIAPYGDNAPNIYLIHGDLTDEEMNSLYNHSKVKAMISFTKGEGYGRPLAEFARTGKPIIASGWSGQLDFLHKDYCTLLPGNLTQVHESAADKFILKESSWFTVNYQYAAKVLKDVMQNYKVYLERSRKMPQHIKENFSRNKMAEVFCKIIDKGLESVPKQVGLKLPQMPKKSNVGGIKLPSLSETKA